LRSVLSNAGKDETPDHQNTSDTHKKMRGCKGGKSGKGAVAAEEHTTLNN